MSNLNAYLVAIKKFKTNSIAYGAMYILPDGTILDLSSLENGHAEFFEATGSTAAELKQKGWLRVNTKIKYIELSANPTSQQQSRLKEIIETFGDDFQIK